MVNFPVSKAVNFSIDKHTVAEIAQEEPPDVYANCLDAVRVFAGAMQRPPTTPDEAHATAELRRLFPGMVQSFCVVAAELDAARA